MGRGSGKRESWRQSVTGEGVLTQVLASGNPLTSGVWWVLKHPWMRLLVAILVLVLDLYVYYGDPATFSNAESYGTLIGDIYAGWLEPGDSTFVFYRIVVMLALTGFGIATGLGVHRLGACCKIFAHTASIKSVFERDKNMQTFCRNTWRPIQPLPIQT